jgi:hypothetical protein
MKEHGILPTLKTVAVDPEQFGIPYGGEASFNIAQRAAFAPIARQITIVSPQASALSARFGGPSGTFRIGDVGDKDVRGGGVLRLDLYRFPTEAQARQFGRRVLPVLITNVPFGSDCPAGTKEVG